jgi:hypothetical protein
MANTNELKTYQKGLILGFLWASALTVFGIIVWGLISLIQQRAYFGIGMFGFIVIVCLIGFYFQIKYWIDNKNTKGRN